MAKNPDDILNSEFEDPDEEEYFLIVVDGCQELIDDPDDSMYNMDMITDILIQYYEDMKPLSEKQKKVLKDFFEEHRGKLEF